MKIREDQQEEHSAPSDQRWVGRSAIAVIAAFGLVLGGAIPATAVFYPWGMASGTYSMKPYGLNPTWTAPMDLARTNWNSSSAKLEVSLNASAWARASAVNLPNETWNGIYYPEVGAFHIQLNQPKLSATPPFATSLRSTFAHELGHSFKLGDNPSSGNASLMNYNRNRHIVYGPTGTDVSEANGNY